MQTNVKSDKKVLYGSLYYTWLICSNESFEDDRMTPRSAYDLTSGSTELPIIYV